MFSYYSFPTWLFTFFAILLLCYALYYLKRFISICRDMKKSKQVSYHPWAQEKKFEKSRQHGKPKLLAIETLLPFKQKRWEKTGNSPKPIAVNSNKAAPDCIDGRLSHGYELNRPPSLVSCESCESFETTTTNSEFYKDWRHSIDLTETRLPAYLRSFFDLNQNIVTEGNTFASNEQHQPALGPGVAVIDPKRLSYEESIEIVRNEIPIETSIKSAPNNTTKSDKKASRKVTFTELFRSKHEKRVKA